MNANAGTLADGQWHRLHPATPLFRGGLVLIVVLGFVIVNFRDLLLEQIFFGSSSGGVSGALSDSAIVLLGTLVVVVVLILIVLGFFLSWRMHTFRITDELVEVRSGVLSRTNRRARLDRIQGINISRPVLPRIFGAAKLEVSVAGDDANIELAFLSSKGADELRQDILQLASGSRAAAQAQAVAPAGVGSANSVAPGGLPAPQAVGLVQGRVNEFLAPVIDPNSAPPESIVRITFPRLIGSIVLSEATFFAILAVIAVITLVSVTQEFAVLFAFFPIAVSLFAYLSARIGKMARYTLASTADGMRIGYGLLSTTNETLPPGRIHAVHVSQPLLWRMVGWWQIRINTASQAEKAQQEAAKSVLLPVGTTAEVHRVLQLIMPSLATDESRGLLEAGLAAQTRGDAYTTTPGRGALLRWFSWRRNGFTLIADVVALRRGFVWRSLTLVPQARMQSISMEESLVHRLMRLAIVQVHTVPGPVLATVNAMDRSDVIQFVENVLRTAAIASSSDTSHRWGSQVSAQEGAPALDTVTVAAAPPVSHTLPAPQQPFIQAPFTQAPLPAPEGPPVQGTLIEPESFAVGDAPPYDGTPPNGTPPNDAPPNGTPPNDAPPSREQI